MMRFYTFGAMIGLVALAVAPVSAQITVYANDFQAGSTSGFSSNSVSSTPGTVAHPTDKFLGEFGNSSVTLSLSGLAAHTTSTVDFDLYMIRSMDGEGQFGGGPDNWSLNVGGGPTLLSTNFANFPGDKQAFQSQVAPNAGGQAVQTGSAQQQTLGYLFNGTPMDAVYHFSYTFANSGNALSFVFAGTPNETIDNESWGLDNVVVKTNANPAAAATPEPGVIGLATAFFIPGIGYLRRRARRK
jgi:hypothetical protein